MGCTSAKPQPPSVAHPPTVLGSLPMKKSSGALFSRGESQMEEEERMPDETPRTKEVITAATTRMMEVEIPSETTQTRTPSPAVERRSLPKAGEGRTPPIEKNPPTEIAVSLTEAS